MNAIVVVPTYNERNNVPVLVKEISDLGLDIDILFVDDNSPDGTGKLIDDLVRENTRIHVVHQDKKMGLGTAYQKGFEEALKFEVKYIIQMDADLSHDPKAIPQLLDGMDRSDLVIGSRYIEGISVVNWTMRRLLLSYAANIYVRWITGLKVNDSTSGFKCFKRNVLESIDLNKVRSNGYAFQIEMNCRVQQKGYKISEIPIIFWGRNSGQSKLSGSVVLEAVLGVWKFRFK